MKFITKTEQKDIFKRLVDIETALATVEGEAAIDGLRAVDHIAVIVGGPQMVKDLEVSND